MSQIVVVTAVGEDRPGIVASLAKAMYEMGANLDDASMTRLHHIFTTMVSAVLPDNVTLAQCRERLTGVERETGVAITVIPVTPQETPQAFADHIITVYGADKPGIVYGVTSRLAAKGVNITDMDTRVAGTTTSPIYIMLIEVAIGDIDIKEDLEDMSDELQVDISLQELDREAL